MWEAILTQKCSRRNNPKLMMIYAGSRWNGARPVSVCIARRWQCSCRYRTEGILTQWSLGDLNESLDGVIFKLILVIDDLGFSGKSALRWTLFDLAGNKSILTRVMVWCRQATSYYLSQCWPSPMSPYGSTRPHSVNSPGTLAQKSCQPGKKM